MEKWIFIAGVIIMGGAYILSHIQWTRALRSISGMRKQPVYNITATAINDVIVYDVDAAASEREIMTLPAGTRVLIRAISRPSPDKWYMIEYGNTTGYCQGNNFML